MHSILQEYENYSVGKEEYLTDGAGITRYSMQKNEVGPLPHTVYKN